MNIVIYDCEIRNGVITDNNAALPGYKYAQGWKDFAGMGIATLCAYDEQENRFRVFMEDNLTHFEDLMSERDAAVGFNNHSFDDRLLEANGVWFGGQTIDLAALIWRAAGIPQGEHPKGLGLDAICRANNLPGKTGNAASAPQDFQDGRFGRVIDYCLADVRSTLALYRYLVQNGGIKDPRNGGWIAVTVPKWLPSNTTHTYQPKDDTQ